MAASYATWRIGCMREGDIRSVVQTEVSKIPNEDRQTLIQNLLSHDLVMEAEIDEDMLRLRLDIGESSSKVAPKFWKGFDVAWQEIEQAAENVTRQAHQMLVQINPSIHPSPIIHHDWSPRIKTPPSVISY